MKSLGKSAGTPEVSDPQNKLFHVFLLSLKQVPSGNRELWRLLWFTTALGHTLSAKEEVTFNYILVFPSPQPDACIWLSNSQRLSQKVAQEYSSWHSEVHGNSDGNAFLRICPENYRRAKTPLKGDISCTTNARKFKNWVCEQIFLSERTKVWGALCSEEAYLWVVLDFIYFFGLGFTFVSPSFLPPPFPSVCSFTEVQPLYPIFISTLYNVIICTK